MNIGAQPAPVAPEKLRPLLHLKIDSMNGDQLSLLSLLNRVLLQIEAEELADRLGAAFERDEAKGKFARIPQLVAQFRAGHRYQ